ncbi:uroporphyrinogen-III C-methyltransferase [Halomonas cupida]|uniref:Uroporphyrin-3 C-methyltransferase n=1 Tax=Halomonas cupida TaxID=44933 RepID=A0A1M7KXM5_9GAMM|nr:uroporphyrinogen-III C-methyltransferase [Halomonas cupida]SHM70294.1 uroporphyrin-3 C-methyltransferase [Halomonas cupida]
MSNQQHDQDEQKTPSGTAQQGAEAASGGKDASGQSATGRSSRRSRRRDKANGSQSSSSSAASSSASSAAADKPAATDSATKKSDSTQEPGHSTQATKADSSTSKSASAASTSQPDKTGSSSKSSPSSAASTGSSSTSSSSAAKGSGSGGGSGRSGGGTGGGKSEDGKSGGGKAGVIALILVLLVIAGLGFIGWKGWQLQQAMNARIDQLKEGAANVEQVRELTEKTGQLETGVNERRQAMTQTIDGIKTEFTDYKTEVNETLDRVLAELSKEQSADSRDWLHAEAAYLLRLANQRLQLERDVEGAAALLRTADNRLREADNPALVPVRRAIAEELAALQGVPRIDRTGLYLALNAEQEQIAGLPLAQDIEELTADTTIAEAPSGPWQEQLSKIGSELKDLVVVRHHDQALEALITPEQESYLRQSLRLVIEQAQVALLKEEQDLYEASLDKAIKLLEGYYDLDDSGVQAVITSLTELKGESIHPELPDISASQQALASFIEQRFEERNSGQENAGQGGDS